MSSNGSLFFINPEQIPFIHRASSPTCRSAQTFCRFWPGWYKAAGSRAQFFSGLTPLWCSPALPPVRTVHRALVPVPQELLSRMQVMPPSSRLLVMVGTAAFIDNARCSRAHGPEEGKIMLPAVNPTSQVAFLVLWMRGRLLLTKDLFKIEF